jgi:hypothetical protein
MSHHHTCPEAAAQHIPLTDAEPTKEELIACLGDDAAKLRNANPEDEMATTMEIAAERLEALSRLAAPVEPADHVGDANDMMPSGRAT